MTEKYTYVHAYTKKEGKKSRFSFTNIERKFGDKIMIYLSNDSKRHSRPWGLRRSIVIITIIIRIT